MHGGRLAEAEEHLEVLREAHEYVKNSPIMPAYNAWWRDMRSGGVFARGFVALSEIRGWRGDAAGQEALLREARDRADFAGATMAMARILAACPSDDIRDGARAVELARSVYDKQKTVASAETLAMAYAETGAFQLAVETQSWAVQQLVPTGLKDAAARAQRQLSAYENKQVCRQPWADDDPYPAIARPVTISDADED